GASGGGKQSMLFPALDDRLAGAVPVCHISSYQAHMGATACVGEVPVGILRYANQWEILGLHARRPLLCIGASRDVPVFMPKEMYATLEQSAGIPSSDSQEQPGVPNPRWSGRSQDGQLTFAALSRRTSLQSTSGATPELFLVE